MSIVICLVCKFITSFVQDAVGVPEALNQLGPSVQQQPLLFRLQDTYYIKVDRQAIQLMDVSCFADAVEFLLKIFYVFDLAYPHELKPTYGFLEKVLQIKLSIGKSTALTDFLRKVAL